MKSLLPSIVLVYAFLVLKPLYAQQNGTVVYSNSNSTREYTDAEKKASYDAGLKAIACDRNDDCVQIKGSCGASVAVNKSNAENVKNLMSKQNISCSNHDAALVEQATKDLLPICYKHSCTLANP